MSNEINEDFEIHINKATKIACSPRKLTFTTKQDVVSNDVNICSLKHFQDGTSVNLAATIISLTPAQPVSTGLVQEATLRDETGTTTRSLWDTNIDKLTTSARTHSRMFLYELIIILKN